MYKLTSLLNDNACELYLVLKTFPLVPSVYWIGDKHYFILISHKSSHYYVNFSTFLKHINTSNTVRCFSVVRYTHQHTH